MLTYGRKAYHNKHIPQTEERAGDGMDRKTKTTFVLILVILLVAGMVLGMLRPLMF